MVENREQLGNGPKTSGPRAELAGFRVQVFPSVDVDHRSPKTLV